MLQQPVAQRGATPHVVPAAAGELEQILRDRAPGARRRRQIPQRRACCQLRQRFVDVADPNGKVAARLQRQCQQTLAIADVDATESCPLDGGPAEVGAAKTGFIEVRIVQGGVVKGRAREVDIVEARIRQTGVAELRVGHLGTDENRRGAVAGRQRRAIHLRPRKKRERHDSPRQIGVFEPCLAQRRADQTGFGHVRLRQVRPGQRGPGQACLRQIGVAQVGAGHARILQIGVRQIGAGQVGGRERGTA